MGLILASRYEARTVPLRTLLPQADALIFLLLQA